MLHASKSREFYRRECFARNGGAVVIHGKMVFEARVPASDIWSLSLGGLQSTTNLSRGSRYKPNATYQVE